MSTVILSVFHGTQTAAINKPIDCDEHKIQSICEFRVKEKYKRSVKVEMKQEETVLENVAHC